MMQPMDVDTILRQFHEISGLRIAIYDSFCNEIYSYPPELIQLCRCYNDIPETHAACDRCNMEGFRTVQKTGKVFSYRCEHGLNEIIAPIYQYGILSAFLMIGQFRENNAQYLSEITKIAMQKLPRKEYAYLLAQQIPVVQTEKIDSYVGVTTILAEYITQTNHLHFRNQNLHEIVKNYLDIYYKSNISLESLSGVFHCSKSTLSKCFCANYHIPVMEYLNQVRMKKAKELLQRSDHSVKEISFLCGYRDPNFFSRAFKKKYNITPLKFREKNRKPD